MRILKCNINVSVLTCSLRYPTAIRFLEVGYFMSGQPVLPLNTAFLSGYTVFL